MTTVNKKNKLEEHSPAVVEGAEDEFIYAESSTRNFEYSDVIKVRSSQTGMLFSFGKNHPDLAGKPLIFREIFLPLDVGWRLKNVLEKQFASLEKDGIIKIEKIDSKSKPKSNAAKENK